MTTVAIDTCVFLHLFNKDPHTRVNEDSHIDHLLSDPDVRKLSLCVDTTKKIGNEYQTKLEPVVKKGDDKGVELQMLRFWIVHAVRVYVPTDPQDDLMRGIRQVIYEPKENADRAFVYVACRGDCCLVTNDDTHILPRRKELWCRTKKKRGRNAKILSSREADAAFTRRLAVKPETVLEIGGALAEDL